MTALVERVVWVSLATSLLLLPLLGLSGALLFYTGNLLWIESRTRRLRQPPGGFERPRHVRVVSALTAQPAMCCSHKRWTRAAT